MLKTAEDFLEVDPYRDCWPLQSYSVQYCNKGQWSTVSEGFMTKTAALKSVDYDLLYYRVINEYGAVV